MNALSEFLHAQAELPEVKAEMDKIVSDVLEEERQEEMKIRREFIRGLKVAAGMVAEARDGLAPASTLYERIQAHIQSEGDE